jgi:hypothetical protein
MVEAALPFSVRSRYPSSLAPLAATTTQLPPLLTACSALVSPKVARTLARVTVAVPLSAPAINLLA